MSRRRLVRLAAPAAFLLAATIGVLLVRTALRGNGDERPARATAARTTTTVTTTTARAPRQPQVQTYTVEVGDTLDQIALDFGTTVEKLRELNPEAEPTALRAGQRLRVP